MDKATITCPKCEHADDLDKFKLLEAALLVCPNCGAEFSLTAELEKLPGGEEGGEEGPPPELELPEPPMAAPAAPPGGEEMPPPPPGESRRSPQGKREPVIQVRVLTCTSCNADWLGAFAETCPNCGEKTVLASTKTSRERATDALEEVDRGVPVERAIDKMLGHFKKSGD